MRYEDGVRRVPAAAVSTVDSRRIARLVAEGHDVRVGLEMGCILHDDKSQANVIAEWTGSEYPDRYIVVGGHLDSWDIGEGAHDDGAGIVHSIEVMRTLQALGYQPRHTIRVVLFINEENGNNGGKTYARVAREKGEWHVAAVESDAGGDSPRGWAIDASDAATDAVRGWREPWGLWNGRPTSRWCGCGHRTAQGGAACRQAAFDGWASPQQPTVFRLPPQRPRRFRECPPP